MTVVPLGALTGEDLKRAGGKAGGLKRLIDLGADVPRGWAVFGDDADSAPLLAAWTAAGSPPVAVRSSAAAEDGGAQSFAGQFLTKLDVRDAAGISAAIAEVMASQRRSTAYGASAGAAAVVVQEMFEPEFAGVAFCRDPQTGEGAVIESVEGRGEALVSGAVTPKRLRLAAGQHDGETHLPVPLARGLFATLRSIESKLGAPQDIEWASRGDRVVLLQCRPQTPTAGLIVGELRSRAGRDTCWSARTSLAETCPAPTPMTWAFLSRMCSWDGGYGRAFRRFGFFFREETRKHGFLELVGGRIYADLDREAGTYFGDWPLAYDFDALRQNPAGASNPTPNPDWRRASFSLWLRLPWYVWKLLGAQRQIDRAMKDFPAEFARRETEIRERARTAKRATTAAEIRARIDRAVGDTAELALSASVLAATIFEKTPAAGRGALRSWIGSELEHRGPNEVELASPRWREMPAELDRLRATAPKPRDGDGIYALRERGKDALLRETEVIRLDLLELGKRTGLGTDVFFLTPDELDHPDAVLAASRRAQRDALLRIPLPPLIFSRFDAPADSGAGNGLSPGTAEGLASLPAALPGYEPPAEAILVLPSLDPAWTLLFSKVRGVVVERGGMLSHGAIVAREMGIPCVCLPGARTAFRDGQRVRIDGDRGTAEIVS